MGTIESWETLEVADDEHGKRRWQRERNSGSERKQRWNVELRRWVTVWVNHR